ncbi:hypothetical protein OF83DRAFT_228944 [Amylostereum chailletii]|nr:hypothetical protein OF83DRAFT_228944 [Amylostereum chailletii]
MAAWTAAPYAMVSSGLMLLLDSLPLKKSDASLNVRGCKWSCRRRQSRGGQEMVQESGDLEWGRSARDRFDTTTREIGEITRT